MIEVVGTRHQSSEIPQSQSDILGWTPDGFPLVAGKIRRLEVRILKSYREDAIPVAVFVVQTATDTEADRIFLVACDLFRRIRRTGVVGLERQEKFQRAIVVRVGYRVPGSGEP